jgi:hypothetical protein
MKKQLLVVASLLLSATAFAAPKDKAPRAQSRPPPCQEQTPERSAWPNGNLLWGGDKSTSDENSTVLAAVDLNSIRLGDTVIKGVRLEGGQLVAPPQAKGLAGALLQGTNSEGKPVEVALCSAQPDANDPSQVWYRIELWNPESATWKNPCIATARVPTPRALAVGGVWNASGAHQDVPEKFTFACENGAIAKCVDWGYKPWAKKDGRSLADLHQACTRMVRADYCGNGRSHTREDRPIDIYDVLGHLKPATEDSPMWTRALASFEAAWTPEGASCLARTRDGGAVEAILKECPERFEAGVKNLGEREPCKLSRKGVSAETALLRNDSYDRDEVVLAPSKAP